MQQKYKVFTSSKQIVFDSSAPEDTNIPVYTTEDIPRINRLLSEFEENPNIQTCYFVDNNVDQLFLNFYSHMNVILAAGGVVYNPDKKILLIYRYKHWDFPKGKIDTRENDEMAAIREVKEETGLKELMIMQRMQPTFHLYHVNDSYEHILKETHWFLMYAPSPSPLKPQVEEDITDAKWVSFAEIEEYKPKMYPALFPLIDETKEFLKF